MKFLCDGMCFEIGRWLRIAGYDTAFVRSLSKDKEVFKQAAEEKRILLTRDHFFKSLDPEEKSIIFLTSDHLETCALQLRERGVDWLFSPFTRCLECNSAFKKILPSDPLWQSLPQEAEEGWQCPSCGQLFWLGTHTKRMKMQLTRWKTEEEFNKK